MDGVHDLGGMHGFGPVPIGRDEPVFHERWEARVFGLFLAATVKGLRSGSPRADVEAMSPAGYLAAGYYERWAHATERSLVRHGVLTTEEIDARASSDAPPPVSGADPVFAASLVSAVQSSDEQWHPARGARFGVGERVTVRRMSPRAHHRCPRYVRVSPGPY